MRRLAMMMLIWVGPAMAQGGFPLGLPGGVGGAGPAHGPAPGPVGGSGAEFCRRVGQAALTCRSGGVALTDPAGLATCLVRALPMADSLRVAQAAQRAQGNPASVLTECGVR